MKKELKEKGSITSKKISMDVEDEEDKSFSNR